MEGSTEKSNAIIQREAEEAADESTEAEEATDESKDEAEAATDEGKDEAEAATKESKDEAEATANESKEEPVEEQVEAKEPDGGNEVEQKAVDEIITVELDKAKKLFKTARRRVEKTDKLFLLEAASDDLDKVTSILESMFELINKEGSQKQKKVFNILMKLTYACQMDCLQQINWIQADEGKDLWDCKGEEDYWNWKKTILKYQRYFPEEITVQALIQEYMKDSKDRDIIKEKIEECKTVEEALMKIELIIRVFREEEEDHHELETDIDHGF